MRKIAIIGAGISGLSSAFYWNENYPEDEITIFESKERGGKIKTVPHEGATLEAGPAYVIANNPAIHDISNKTDTIDQLIKSSESRGFYINQGYMTKTPTDFLSIENGMLSFLGGGLNTFFSAKKKITLWDNITLFDVLKITYGQSYAETLGSVYSRFKFHCEADDLDFTLAFPEYSKIVNEKGNLKESIQTYGEQEKNQWKDLFSDDIISKFKPGYYNFKSGLIGLIDAIYNSLKSNPKIQFDFEKVANIKIDNNNYQIHSKHKHFGPFEKVIFATSAKDASAIWKNTDKELSNQLSNIQYQALNTIYFAWPKKQVGSSGAFVYAPNKEKLSLYGVEFISAMFPELFNPDYNVLRCMVPGDLSMLNDDDLASLVAQDLKKAFSIEATPGWVKVFHNKEAISFRNKTNSVQTKEILQFVENYPEVVFAGSDFEGPGIADLLIAAKKRE